MLAVLTCEVEYTLDVGDRVLVKSVPAQKKHRLPAGGNLRKLETF